MKYLKMFESIDTWDKHPKFDDAVKIIKKALEKGEKGGVNWISELLGDSFPENKAFARRVLIKASSILNQDKK